MRLNITYLRKISKLFHYKVNLITFFIFQLNLLNFTCKSRYNYLKSQKRLLAYFGFQKFSVLNREKLLFCIFC